MLLHHADVAHHHPAVHRLHMSYTVSNPTCTASLITTLCDYPDPLIAAATWQHLLEAILAFTQNIF